MLQDREPAAPAPAAAPSLVDPKGARVLWFSNETPDREGQGGQRRQFNQIASLARRGHEVHVLTLAGPQDQQSLSGVAAGVQRFAPFYDSGRRNPVRIGVPRRRARAGYDALVVAHLESWQWFKHARGLPPTLLDLHNVYADWYERRGEVATARRVNAEQRVAVAAVDAVAVCSALEARRLTRGVGDLGDKVMVSPHGIDPHEWPDSAAVSARGSVVALFGSWDWDPNALGLEWFVREVWPRVVLVVPHALAEVAGTGVQLADAEAVPGLRIVGRVEDLSAFLGSAGAVALPVLQGVGASVKYAEALASGAPVLATPDAASAHPGAPARVTQSADHWVSWLIEKLREPRQQVDGARDWALRELTWDQTTSPIDSWLRRTLSSADGRYLDRGQPAALKR